MESQVDFWALTSTALISAGLAALDFYVVRKYGKALEKIAGEK